MNFIKVDCNYLLCLIDLLNVGLVCEKDLCLIGICVFVYVCGCDVYDMYVQLCLCIGVVYDFCVIDVFLFIVCFMQGEVL